MAYPQDRSQLSQSLLKQRQLWHKTTKYGIVFIISIAVSLWSLIPNAHASTITTSDVTISASTTSASNYQSVTLSANVSGLSTSGTTLTIENTTDGYYVGDGASGASVYSATDAHVNQIDSYVGVLISSTTEYQSASISVSWSGGSTPPSNSPAYTTSCASSGNGAETVNFYNNGTASGSSNSPLVITGYQVTSDFLAPSAELTQEGTSSFVTTSLFPIYARPYTTIATRVWIYPPLNMSVTAYQTFTLTPPSGATDPSSGSTLSAVTWSVPLVQQVNGYIFASAFTLPKAYPDGSILTGTITATDACGSESVTLGSIPSGGSTQEIAILSGKATWLFDTITG